MRAIGVDLSGPVNTADTAVAHLRRYDDCVRVVSTELGVSDEELRQHLMAAIDETDGGVALGLDAPLSYEPGGGLRASDRALREALAERGFSKDYVLAPTMTRMIYLTVRGMTVARWFEANEQIEIFEVHPVAALLMRGVPEGDASAMKASPESRERVLKELRSMGVESLPDAVAESDHLLCAVAAALGAHDAACDRAAWRYGETSPHHPFDLVC